MQREKGQVEQDRPDRKTVSIKQGVYVQDKEAQCHDSLANAAGRTARVSRVVGSLGCEGREPYDDEDGIDRNHGLRQGKSTCPGESRGHDEVDPCGDREEALEETESARLARCQVRATKARQERATSGDSRSKMQQDLPPQMSSHCCR